MCSWLLVREVCDQLVLRVLWGSHVARCGLLAAACDHEYTSIANGNRQSGTLQLGACIKPQ